MTIRPLLLFAACCTAKAATTLTGVADVSTSNLPESPEIEISQGRVDWIKLAGETTIIRKNGGTALGVSVVGGAKPGTFKATASHRVPKFGWADGTAPCASPDNSNQSNLFIGGEAPGGWRIDATGLRPGTYKLNLYGARTDNTPFSIEAYAGDTLLVRKTVNGATGDDGVAVDNLVATLSFATTEATDTFAVRFVRDSVNGKVGQGNASSNNILALAAVTLAELAPPATQPAGGADDAESGAPTALILGGLAALAAAGGLVFFLTRGKSGVVVKAPAASSGLSNPPRGAASRPPARPAQPPSALPPPPGRDN